MTNLLRCKHKLALFMGLAILGGTPAHAQAIDISKPVLISPSLFLNISDSIDTKKAQQFIETMGSDAIGFLGNPNLSQAQKSKEFKKLLEKSYDIETIGKFALGRNWKVASSSERKEYQKLFKDMIVDVYSNRFSDYNGEEFTVTSVNPKNDKDALVTSYLSPANGGAKVQIDWRVRRQSNGQYKIIDVIVEGVSMALTQRSEFASVIQRGGGKIDALLVHLRK